MGDSYAFGMAGTGGTSSVSPPAELWTLRGLGVGSRDAEMLWLSRCWSEPLDVRTEVLLVVLDERESPEL